MAELLAGGPGTSKRLHAFPSQSHVSPVETPSLVPSGCGTVCEPPNRITPRFSGSYTRTAPALGPGPVADGIRVGPGCGVGEGEAAEVPAVLFGARSAPLLATAAAEMTVRAPSPKPDRKSTRLNS